MTDGAETVMYYAGLDCSAGTNCTSSIFRSVSADGGQPSRRAQSSLPAVRALQKNWAASAARAST